MIVNNYGEESQSLANIFKYFQNEIKKRRSTKIPKQILVNFLDRAKTGDLCRGLNMLKSTDGQGRTFSILKYTAFTIHQSGLLGVNIFLSQVL